jgi:hypothetical protein
MFPLSFLSLSHDVDITSGANFEIETTLAVRIARGFAGVRTAHAHVSAPGAAAMI